MKLSGFALTASRRRSRPPTEARRAQLRGKFHWQPDAIAYRGMRPTSRYSSVSSSSWARRRT